VGRDVIDQKSGVKDKSKEPFEEVKMTCTVLKKPKKELNWELSMLILKHVANNDGETLTRVKKRSKG